MVRARTGRHAVSLLPSFFLYPGTLGTVCWTGQGPIAVYCACFTDGFRQMVSVGNCHRRWPISQDCRRCMSLSSLSSAAASSPPPAPTRVRSPSTANTMTHRQQCQPLPACLWTDKRVGDAPGISRAMHFGFCTGVFAYQSPWRNRPSAQPPALLLLFPQPDKILPPPSPVAQARPQSAKTMAAQGGGA